MRKNDLNQLNPTNKMYSHEKVMSFEDHSLRGRKRKFNNLSRKQPAVNRRQRFPFHREEKQNHDIQPVPVALLKKIFSVKRNAVYKRSASPQSSHSRVKRHDYVDDYDWESDEYDYDYEVSSFHIHFPRGRHIVFRNHCGPSSFDRNKGNQSTHINLLTW